MHDPMRPSSHISQENCGSTTANYMVCLLLKEIVTGSFVRKE